MRLKFMLMFLLIGWFSITEAAEVMPEDSPVKIDLYGAIVANAYWNSTGVVGSDIPLWVVSGNDARAEDTEFGLIARQTRFGVKVKTSDVGKAKLSGVMEADFFGGFPAAGQSASFADLRLRLAYMKLDWERSALTVGQDWIILAPLNPTSLSHFAVAGLSASGNLWLRYPLVRFDATRSAGAGKLGFTGGIVRPVGGSDVPAGGTLIDTAGAGERSSMPFWQGRLFHSRPSGNKTLALGLSGHYGQENYKLGTTTISESDLDTWAVAGDFQIPMGDTFTVQGELFTGSNLDSFQAGINQGFSLNGTNFGDSTSINPIDSNGGWVQLSVAPAKCKDFTFHLAYGIDNPDDGVLSRGQKSENASVMASVFYKPTKHFQTAFEYSWIRTKYKLLESNDASVINVAFAFTF